MRRLLAALLLLAGCASSHAVTRPNAPLRAQHWGIVIHGGAGNLDPAKMSLVKQGLYRAKLQEALQAGHDVLARGGSSTDAVVAALTILEDSPLFNAGKGAVFTHDGRNELDAAIMDGARHTSGAVANVHRVKNPIQLARLVMDRSKHVLFVGDGAEQFAESQGMALVDPKYFFTEERWQQLQDALEKDRAGQPSSSRGETPIEGGYKFGTVGAVALDAQGHLTAGTSTGGITNKLYGRVGDSPIVGAGTYADGDCALSATGEGEFFIRYTVTKDICARMEYLREPFEKAATDVINGELVEVHGEGGVIGMDRDGEVVMPFNTTGMFRGVYLDDTGPLVWMFREQGAP